MATRSKSEERRRKIQKPETPEEKAARELVEEIATNIDRLAGLVRVLINGRLKKEVIVVILARSSGLSQENVSKVLNAISTMDVDTLKQ